MIVKMAMMPLKVVGLTAKVIGYRRVALLGTGVAIGMVVTPVSGPELRRKISEEIAKRRAGSEPTIEDRVRQHLSTSPRTWHLPQPEVVAVRAIEGPGWEIILAGSVPDANSRSDLELACTTVSGVLSVDNRLRVEPLVADDS